MWPNITPKRALVFIPRNKHVFNVAHLDIFPETFFALLMLPNVSKVGRTDHEEVFQKNSSRYRSSDGSWNVRKNERIPKNKSSNMSPSTYRWVPKRDKNENSSKINGQNPICVSPKILRPDYRWVPKSSQTQSPTHSVHTKCQFFDKRDMIWQQVKSVDLNGQPRVHMDWVPKSN